MYVQFTSPNVPTIDTMYWRALVLWDYGNGAWTPGIRCFPIPHEASAAPDPDQIISQKITIDRHNQKWLFALDAPVSAPVNGAEPPSWATLLTATSCN